MRSVVPGALVLALAWASPSAARADTKSPAMAVLERAAAHEREPNVLAQALAELDSILSKRPRDADAHYVRGWVLTRIGKREDAVRAYDRAYELDPRLVDAIYNAGVVLGQMGKTKQAARRFDRVLDLSPKHVDAAYNAGQSYYDLGEYATAAARWEVAAKLTPDDFQVAKKLVQAYVALGKSAAIAKARERVFAMWKARKPGQPTLTSYVYDQFDVGKYHVFVYEAFEPSDTEPKYRLKVAFDGRVVGTVDLEHGASGYSIGVTQNGEHAVDHKQRWKQLPTYAAFKIAARRLVALQFAP